MDRAVELEFLLRLGDSTLILGQRVAEWCGHAPALEEDIAMANIGLDLIGQCQHWLGLAAEVEGKGRSADDLAFLRDAWEFRNLLLCERPNTDYAHAITRQFFFDAWNAPLLVALSGSADEKVAEIAAKTAKEASYHLDRSRDVFVALGDGTEESNQRMQAGVDVLWAYAGEMFVEDPVDLAMKEAGVGPDLGALQGAWDAVVRPAMAEARLNAPGDPFVHSGGKDGRMHTEHLGHLLATMQWLQRAYPGASW